MSAAKRSACNNVCNYEHTCWNVLLVEFLEEQFPHNKGNQRHKEQPQHHFLYDAAVQNRCNHTAHGQTCDISSLNAVNHTAKYPMVKTEYNTTDYGDYKRNN